MPRLVRKNNTQLSIMKFSFIHLGQWISFSITTTRFSFPLRIIRCHFFIVGFPLYLYFLFRLSGGLFSSRKLIFPTTSYFRFLIANVIIEKMEIPVQLTIIHLIIDQWFHGNRFQLLKSSLLWAQRSSGKSAFNYFQLGRLLKFSCSQISVIF